MESHEALKRATGKVGVKAVAADMNLSSSLIYKWCQPRDFREAGGAENPLDRLVKICRITDDVGPIEWLCEQVNGFLVKNSSPDETTSVPLLKVTQEILRNFSDLLEGVSTSIENDGRVDRVEAQRIRADWEQLKRVTEGFVSACERGVYGDERQQ